MSVWTDHVKKTYDAGRKKDSKYSYKQAMSDAKNTYKKGGSEKNEKIKKKEEK